MYKTKTKEQPHKMMLVITKEQAQVVNYMLNLVEDVHTVPLLSAAHMPEDKLDNFHSFAEKFSNVYHKQGMCDDPNCSLNEQ